MLKRALIVVGIFAFAAVARADMTVDGDISDWPSALIQTDGSNDNAGSEAEMLRWGAIMTGGNLYGFIEMDTAIATYDSGTNDLWAGLWVDVDQQGGPGNTPSSLDHNAGQLGAEWAGNVFEGFDFLVEWGVNEGHWGEGYNFWGAGDTAGGQGSAISGGAKAYAGNIIEFSVPLSEIFAELATYPDNVTPGSLWDIGARAEASIGGNGPWGGDNSDTIVTAVIPEPATLTIFTLGVGLLLLLLRRFKK